MSTGPDAVARSLFIASTEARSGTLIVEARGAIGRVTVDGGWVHALANVGPRNDRGEEMLGAWLRRLPDDAAPRFEPIRASEAALGGWARVSPFHPARALRRHFEARPVRVEPGRFGGRFKLRLAPHPSCLGPDEVGVVRLLDAHRTLAELEASRLLAAVRLEALLAFLDAAGVLDVEDASLIAAWSLFGLPPGAPTEEVRRAYHRLARTLHPDLHPGASTDERRALEGRLYALTAAYRSILGQPR